ncbi:MAG: carbon-nitrogen hydrolase family protein [Bacteroidota bacterium]
MKICVAQYSPVKGDIAANITRHKKWIELAVTNGADLVIFPELSITGYEPELAQELAVSKDDQRFDEFQNIADSKNIAIGIGAPTRSNGSVCISMIIFQTGRPRVVYHKQYLHSSETPFFASGRSFSGLLEAEVKVAVAICYEISVAEHAAMANLLGAKIYVASLVESFTDIDKAHRNLSAIATKYNIPVLMSNSVGKTGNYNTAGRSAIWNGYGMLLQQLNDCNEGILIFDTGKVEASVPVLV